MHHEGVLIHDYTFTDPNNKNTLRELPYIMAYVTAAERVYDKLSPEDQLLVRSAINSNYKFLTKKAAHK